MSLTAQGLSPLFEDQGDHLAAGIALEGDLGANGFGNERVLIDGRDLKRPLTGALDEELGIRDRYVQRESRRERIVAFVFVELRLGRSPFAGGRRDADALGLQRASALEP